MLLPPGWRDLEVVRCRNRGRPVGDHQPHGAHGLAQPAAQRWMALRYSDLVANPRQAVSRICRFAGLEFDAALDRRVAQLPVSRHTQTPPAPDKWRRNEQAVLGVLPGLEATWRELEALDAADRVGQVTDV